MLSFALSALKPHDKGIKGEQKPRYSHYNGSVVAPERPDTVRVFRELQ